MQRNGPLPAEMAPYTGAVCNKGGTDRPTPRITQRNGPLSGGTLQSRGQRCPQTPRNLRRRRLFKTTNTDENAMAAPAIMGVSRPDIAKGIAALL